jgi:heme-degrading monooxygenase HmoA
MIARVWRGVVAADDGDAYAEYMKDTGVAGYAKIPGNRGVWMLRRPVAEGEEFMMFTLWESLEAVKRFAGSDYETAVFYPEDERFLIHRERSSTHYEVDTSIVPGSGHS